MEIGIKIKQLHFDKKPYQDTVTTYQIFIDNDKYSKLEYDQFRTLLQHLVALHEGKLIKWNDDPTLSQGEPYLNVYRPTISDSQERRITVTIPNYE